MANFVEEWRKPIIILTGVMLFGIATWISWSQSFQSVKADLDGFPAITILDESAELRVEGYYYSYPFTSIGIVRKYHEAADISARISPRSGVGYLVASPHIADSLRRCSYRSSSGTLTEADSLPSDLASSAEFDALPWLKDGYVVFTFNSSVECAAPDSAFWTQSGARFTFTSPYLHTFTLNNRGQIATSSSDVTCASVSVSWEGQVEKDAQSPAPTATDSNTNANASTWGNCKIVRDIGLTQDYQGSTETSITDLGIQDADNRWLFTGGAFVGIMGAFGVELFLSIYETVDRRRAKLPPPDWEPDSRAYL